MLYLCEEDCYRQLVSVLSLAFWKVQTFALVNLFIFCSSCNLWRFLFEWLILAGRNNKLSKLRLQSKDQSCVSSSMWDWLWTGSSGIVMDVNDRFSRSPAYPEEELLEEIRNVNKSLFVFIWKLVNFLWFSFEPGKPMNIEALRKSTGRSIKCFTMPTSRKFSTAFGSISPKTTKNSHKTLACMARQSRYGNPATS